MLVMYSCPSLMERECMQEKLYVDVFLALVVCAMHSMICMIYYNDFCNIHCQDLGCVVNIYLKDVVSMHMD
jgi:hypothetical protein